MQHQKTLKRTRRTQRRRQPTLKQKPKPDNRFKQKYPEVQVAVKQKWLKHQNINYEQEKSIINKKLMRNC